MVLADTGFWVALLNPRDACHQRACAAAERHETEGFVTTQPVVTEACHLLSARRRPAEAVRFVQALAETRTELFELSASTWPRVAKLMTQYLDLPMDYADASLVLLAEHLGHGRILTTDRRDFGSYRWKSRYPFENLLEDPL